MAVWITAIKNIASSALRAYERICLHNSEALASCNNAKERTTEESQRRWYTNLVNTQWTKIDSENTSMDSKPWISIVCKP